MLREWATIPRPLDYEYWRQEPIHDIIEIAYTKFLVVSISEFERLSFVNTCCPLEAMILLDLFSRLFSRPFLLSR